MIRSTLKACPLLFLYLLALCPKIHAAPDTIPASRQLPFYMYPIYILDGKEIDYQAVKKLNPKAIEKTEGHKPTDAVRGYGIRARFGVIKITSGKTPVSFKGPYSCTLYFSTDHSKAVGQRTYNANNLDTLFYEILKAHPEADLLIDNLISYGGDTNASLQTISGAFNFIHMKSYVDSVSISVAEAIFYTSKNYLSGKFYFSGNNFTSVVTCNANDRSCIQANLKKCSAGSIITLEGCQLKNSNSTYEFVSKSIKLD